MQRRLLQYATVCDPRQISSSILLCFSSILGLVERRSGRHCEGKHSCMSTTLASSSTTQASYAAMADILELDRGSDRSAFEINSDFKRYGWQLHQAWPSLGSNMARRNLHSRKQIE